MVELLITRELLPEFDLLSVQKCNMLLLFLLGGFDLNVDLITRLLDEAIVILEVQIDLGCVLAGEIVECLFDSIAVDS